MDIASTDCQIAYWRKDAGALASNDEPDTRNCTFVPPYFSLALKGTERALIAVDIAPIFKISRVHQAAARMFRTFQNERFPKIEISKNIFVEKGSGLT